MTQYADFYKLLSELADLFEQDPRAGGHDVAFELHKIGGGIHMPLPRGHDAIPDVIAAALACNALPIADKIVPLMHQIDWHHTGHADGRVRPEIAEQMATAELVGPDGMVFHEKFRAGLFVQSANVNYVTRKQAANECFAMIGGSGFWQTNDHAPVKKIAGDIIIHPANTPHSSITKDEPLIAAWFWTGDISYDKYQLTG